MNTSPLKSITSFSIALPKKAASFAVKHKIISVVILAAVLGGGYWGYTIFAANNAGTQYTLARVSQAPLQVTVTGSGQVVSQNQLNLTPQASGQITHIYVKPGQVVKAGTLVATLDMTNAAQSVITAKQNLASAQIAYQQQLVTSNISATSDSNGLQTAQVNTNSSISTTMANLPEVMTGIDQVLHNFSTLPGYSAFPVIYAYQQYVNSSLAHQYHDQVVQDDAQAITAYQNVIQENANQQTLTADQTIQTAKDTLQALQTINTLLKDSLTYYNYINDQVQQNKMIVPAQLASQVSNLTSYQSTVSGDISSITNAETSLENAQQTLQRDTQASSAGNTTLDIQSAELNVQKAQEAVTQAETTESNYIVRAPFDGTIATVPANQYDQASSGTTIATLITSEKYADLSLNESDAAKVHVGQAATMTFDALPNVTMNGAVAQVSPIGVITQGVVSYDVKISFAQLNPDIKSGMTVQASIVTESSTNAIQVPSAAVHTTNGNSYVQVATITNASSSPAFSGGGANGSSTNPNQSGVANRTRTASSTALRTSGGTRRALTLRASSVTITNVPVVTGLSNDTQTEIVSGLQPGQFVVTATQTGSAKPAASTAKSATSILGGGNQIRTGGGGGGNRPSGGGG